MEEKTMKQGLFLVLLHTCLCITVSAQAADKLKTSPVSTYRESKETSYSSYNQKKAQAVGYCLYQYLNSLKKYNDYVDACDKRIMRFCPKEAAKLFLKAEKNLAALAIVLQTQNPDGSIIIRYENFDEIEAEDYSAGFLKKNVEIYYKEINNLRKISQTFGDIAFQLVTAELDKLPKPRALLTDLQIYLNPGTEQALQQDIPKIREALKEIRWTLAHYYDQDLVRLYEKKSLARK
jgi:hypothetical protein